MGSPTVVVAREWGAIAYAVVAAIVMIGYCAAVHADMSLESVYLLNCSGCHGQDGKGVPAAGIPDLHDSGLYVKTGRGREYLIQVPGLSQSNLDDPTVALVLNWVLRRFSADRLPPDFKPYTVEEVAISRKDKASDAQTRRSVLLSELNAPSLRSPAPAKVQQ